MSAALTAGYAGHGQALGPHYPGVAEDCCRGGVPIRLSGPILTMDRRRIAVLPRVSQLIPHHECRSLCAGLQIDRRAR
jgi:hypothetical protein